MWLSNASDWLNRVVSPVSKVTHRIGVGVLAVMMFLTAGDVTLRYVFNKPIPGSFDLTEYMMAIVVAFSLAYCAVMKGHVRVDIVVARFPQRAQAIIDIITGLISIGILSLITWQCFVHMKALSASKVTSSVLYIPSFPFAGLVGFGSALFTLVLLTNLIDYLYQAVRR